MWEVDVCSSSVQPTIQHNKARIMSIIRGISFEYSSEEFFRTLKIVWLSTHTRHVFQKISRKTLLSLAACMFFAYSHLYLVIVSTALFFWEIRSCTIRTLIWKLYNLKWRRKKKSRKWRRKKIVKCLETHIIHHDSCGCRSTLLVAAVLARQF